MDGIENEILREYLDTKLIEEYIEQKQFVQQERVENKNIR